MSRKLYFAVCAFGCLLLAALVGSRLVSARPAANPPLRPPRRANL